MADKPTKGRGGKGTKRDSKTGSGPDWTSTEDRIKEAAEDRLAQRAWAIDWLTTRVFENPDSKPDDYASELRDAILKHFKLKDGDKTLAQTRANGACRAVESTMSAVKDRMRSLASGEYLDIYSVQRGLGDTKEARQTLDSWIANVIGKPPAESKVEHSGAIDTSAQDDYWDSLTDEQRAMLADACPE